MLRILLTRFSEWGKALLKASAFTDPNFSALLRKLLEVFPVHQRGMAMGIFTAGISVGPAIGPSIGGYLVEHLILNVLMVVLPREKVMMGSGLRGLMNGLGSTFGVAMAARFVEKQQAIHALACSEDQSLYPIGASEAVTAAREYLSSAGEWDLLPTRAMLLVRQTLLDEAAMLAYRDCYLAIAVSSLLSLTMTLF